MASDNKQIIRGIYDAFNRGDMDAVVNAMTDDVEWNAPGGAPFSGIRRGPRAVADYLHEIARWARIDEFDVDDVLADGHKVVALGRQRATVKATGRHWEQQWAHVFTMRNGKIAAAHLYGDTHAVASAFGESAREREALLGPMGVTEPAFSGGEDRD